MQKIRNWSLAALLTPTVFWAGWYVWFNEVPTIEIYNYHISRFSDGVLALFLVWAYFFYRFLEKKVRPMDKEGTASFVLDGFDGGFNLSFYLAAIGLLLDAWAPESVILATLGLFIVLGLVRGWEKATRKIEPFLLLTLGYTFGLSLMAGWVLGLWVSSLIPLLLFVAFGTVTLVITLLNILRYKISLAT
ncbi:MAG: hypothetical protein WD874_00450 [Parcubacteria group bacterium]